MNILKAILIMSLFLSAALSAEDIDFISILKKSEAAKAVGLEKLTAEELAAWNVILNRTYQLGVNQKKEGDQPEKKAVQDDGLSIYIAKATESEGEIIKLDNGGIVEVTLGFVGFVGFRKEIFLFREGVSWKIWIEGKKLYRCELLKAPEVAPTKRAVKVFVAEVKGDGKILKMLDGSMYEVSDLDKATASFWFGNFDAIIVDDLRLINLDDSSSGVAITKIR